MIDTHKTVARLADEWRHTFWIEAMRAFVADLRAYALAHQRQADEAVEEVAQRVFTARADECDRIASELDAEITRLENWS